LDLIQEQKASPEALFDEGEAQLLEYRICGQVVLEDGPVFRTVFEVDLDDGIISFRTEFSDRVCFSYLARAAEDQGFVILVFEPIFQNLNLRDCMATS